MIQAYGTSDYKLDAVNRGKRLQFEQPSGDWDMVEGELMYFSRPDSEIPPLDYLEHFNPDGECNLYHRVMLTFKTEDGLVNAWTYVIIDGKYTGKRLSLNEDGLVKWNKPKSGYIEPKGQATASSSLDLDRLVKDKLNDKRGGQSVNPLSAKSCSAGNSSSSCSAF